jgi:hypothetical protein
LAPLHQYLFFALTSYCRSDTSILYRQQLDSREKRRLGKNKKIRSPVQYVVDESNVPPGNGRPPTLDEPTRTDSEPDETGELFDLPENKIVRKWTKQKPNDTKPATEGRNFVLSC